MFNVADKFKEDLNKFREERGETSGKPSLWLGIGLSALLVIAGALILRSPERIEKLRKKFRKAA